MFKIEGLKHHFSAGNYPNGSCTVSCYHILRKTKFRLHYNTHKKSTLNIQTATKRVSGYFEVDPSMSQA